MSAQSRSLDFVFSHFTPCISTTLLLSHIFSKHRPGHGLRNLTGIGMSEPNRPVGGNTGQVIGYIAEGNRKAVLGNADGMGG